MAIGWHHAPAPLRRALALPPFTGMRVGDFVTVAWANGDGEVLSWRQSLTGYDVRFRVPEALRNELNNAARHSPQILTTHEEMPYVRDGVQSVNGQLGSRLKYLRLVQPGLCFHALQHSLGAALLDLGLDREARRPALGHNSDAASAMYDRR